MKTFRRHIEIRREPGRTIEHHTALFFLAKTLNELFVYDQYETEELAATAARITLDSVMAQTAKEFQPAFIENQKKRLPFPKLDAKRKSHEQGNNHLRSVVDATSRILRKRRNRVQLFFASLVLPGRL